MPLYNYSCADCGPFRAWQSMSNAAEPVACPTCAGLAARMVSAPFVANMDPHNRIAHQRNEKSAHEPRVATHQMLHGQRRTAQHRHAHRHAPTRPWTIGH